jgi:hypothetical protein
MSKSVLLTIARASIEEVLQAQSSINRKELIEQYPILAEPMATQVILYHDNKIRGNSITHTPRRSLLEDIIHNAKIAAFQDENFDPLVTSEYLHTTIELTLFSPDGPLMHKDPPILKER